MVPSEYLAVKEMAKRLSCKSSTIYKYMYGAGERRLPSEKIMGLRRVRATDFEAWLKAEAQHNGKRRRG